MNKLYITDTNLEGEANTLASFTGKLSVCKTKPEDDIYLQLDKDGLCIITSQFQPLYVREIYNKVYQRKDKLSSELLIQAVKIKPASDILIIDATAGLAKDALLLALYGYQVLMIEQNPILATIIYYALLNRDILSDNLQLVFGNSIKYLNEYSGMRPYAIYLDPMFKKSDKALAKKDMQIIQLIAANEYNSDEELFTISSKLAKKVIIKRDNKQEPLVIRPAATYTKDGKTIRYDIYCL